MVNTHEENVKMVHEVVANSTTNTHKQHTNLQRGVNLAPANLPRARRLQTVAVTSFWWMMPISIIIFVVCLCFPPLWVILIPYIVYWLIDNAHDEGGRRFDYMRRLSYWNYFSDYFPCVLVKEADIDPTKNYIFGYHPHGIISVGAMINFCSEATGFSDKFPGLRISLCTLTSNFTYPIMRELLMSVGLVSVSRQSIIANLRAGPGSGVAIVLGGAAESLDAVPKTADLTLSRRKGFVKIALREGANLVPVFCFGENDIYTQYHDEKIKKLQQDMMKTVGFTLPMFHGRGFFQYNFGLTPMRKPLVTIVGKPIELPKLDNPTQDDVDKYHQEYIDALKDIYNRWKQDLAPDRKSSMNIVA